MEDFERTASLMTPAKLAEARPKVAASPAAWLDQMAADAGHQHVRRLGDLAPQLQALVSQGDLAPLAHQVEQTGAAVEQLNVDLLQVHGWWARATGKARSAGLEFGTQADRVEEAARELAVQLQGWHSRRSGESGSADRTLVELAVEFSAIDKIIDQAARWLQDMRNQLKARQAAAQQAVPPDAQVQQQIRDDTARCEILVARLKVLRSVVGAAQKVHELSQDLVTRRSALPNGVQQPLLPQLKAWAARLASLAALAGEAGGPGVALEEAVKGRRELRRGIKQLLAEHQQCDAQEPVLAQALANLAAQVKAAG